MADRPAVHPGSHLCNGCGTEVLDPSQEQVDEAVDQVLSASLNDARQHGGVCPLCGHSKQEPLRSRKTVLFALLLCCLLVLSAIAGTLYYQHQTERAAVMQAALSQLQTNSAAIELLGSPLAVEPDSDGRVTHDETGWQEAHLHLIVKGPLGEAEVRVTGSREKKAWSFTTFEVIVERQHRRLDLLTNRVTSYDPTAYIDIHTMAAMQPQLLRALPPPPTSDGAFPCIAADAGSYSSKPMIGRCATPTVHAARVDRFEVDFDMDRLSSARPTSGSMMSSTCL